MIIWHNPHCSKSRETLKILRERGHQPVIRTYLDDPPSLEELQTASRLLECPPQLFIRHKEQLFRELGLSLEDDAQTLFSAMAKYPKLIERPIVFLDDRAILGRPPQAVTEALSQYAHHRSNE